jgi:toxin CcdB
MIRRYDVFPNPIRAGRADKPYLICLQHHFLEHLGSRIMASLVRKRAIETQWRLYPPMNLLDQTFYFDPTDLSTIPTRFLKTPIANLEAESFRIAAALDLVFTGV